MKIQDSKLMPIYWDFIIAKPLLNITVNPKSIQFPIISNNLLIDLSLQTFQ